MDGIGIELTQSPIAFGAIFPDLEEELRGFNEFSQSMRYVGAPETTQRYHTRVDYLFSEFFGRAWRMRCFKFYENKGPSLSEVLSPGEIAHFQSILLLAAKFARVCALKKRRVHWCRFRSEVLNLALSQGVGKPTPKWLTIHKPPAMKLSRLVALGSNPVKKCSAEAVLIGFAKRPARRRPLR